MKKRIMGIVLTAVMLAAALSGCGSNAAAPAASTAPSEAPEAVESTAPEAKLSGSVSTDGSTSMEKVIGALGEAFTEANPDVNFTYNPTGSGSGITAVSEGRCDIGLSSRNLKDEEAAKGLKATVLALDGIAVIVNPENPISELSLEQIAKI